MNKDFKNLILHLIKYSRSCFQYQEQKYDIKVNEYTPVMVDVTEVEMSPTGLVGLVLILLHTSCQCSHLFDRLANTLQANETRITLIL